jgi:hypothetical protein
MALKKPLITRRIFLSTLLEEGKTLNDIDLSKTYSVYDDANYKRPVTEIRPGYFNKESGTHLYILSFDYRTVKEYAPRWIVTELKKVKVERIPVVQYWTPSDSEQISWRASGWLIEKTLSPVVTELSVTTLKTDEYGNPIKGYIEIQTK